MQTRLVEHISIEGCDAHLWLTDVRNCFFVMNYRQGNINELHYQKYNRNVQFSSILSICVPRVPLLVLALFNVLVKNVSKVLPAWLGDEDGVSVGTLHLQKKVTLVFGSVTFLWPGLSVGRLVCRSVIISKREVNFHALSEHLFDKALMFRAQLLLWWLNIHYMTEFEKKKQEGHKIGKKFIPSYYFTFLFFDLD